MTEKITVNYVPPSSLHTQINRYWRQYYLFVFFGAFLCLAPVVTYLLLNGLQSFRQSNFLNFLFLPISILTAIFLIPFRRNDSFLKNLLSPLIGNLPANFSIILAAAMTFEDEKIRNVARKFHRFQLLGASIAGYFCALAIPLVLYIANLDIYR